MSVAQKAIGGFFRVMGGVVLFFAVLITVIVVGANHEEKQAATERKAQAEARAKAIASAGPYGLPPKTEWGEVTAVRKWLDTYAIDARPTDWWGPHKSAYVKDGENVLCWRVSVAYTARKENGEFYLVRRLFYLREDKIIGTEFVD